ncbi:hypothetical protein FOZ63_028221, partial [Perkinsus olseni]
MAAANRQNSARKAARSWLASPNWWIYAAAIVAVAGIILGSWLVDLRESALTPDDKSSASPGDISRETILDWTNVTARRIADDFASGPFESSKALLNTLRSDTYGGYVGARVKSVPGLSKEERGLFARKKFAKGDVVMQIPRTAWYSQDDIPTALASVIGISRLQRASPEVQRVGMGLGLLYEVTSLSSNETKGWLHNRLGKSRVTDKELLKQWFNSLPDSFDSIVRFNTNQSALLFGPAREELRRLEKFLVTCRSLAAVMPSMFGIESMESEAAQLHIETLARWAWGVILSRTGVAKVKEATGAERDLVLLLPGVSLLNTAMGNWNLQDPECSHEGCSVRARRFIRKGEELTMDYGLKSNLQFLIYGGFTIPENHLGCVGGTFHLTSRILNVTKSGSEAEAWMKESQFSKCRDPFVIGLDSDWDRMVKCSRSAQYAVENNTSHLKQLWASGALDHLPSELSSLDLQALQSITTSLRERVDEINRRLASVDITVMEADSDPLGSKLLDVVRQELEAAIAWRDKAEAL